MTQTETTETSQTGASPAPSSTTTKTESPSPSERAEISLFGLRPRVVAAVRNIDRDGDSSDLNEAGVEELDFEVDLSEANVVTSLAGDGYGTRYHRPVLDLDIPARLVPSSTYGHSHLYIDRLLSWDQYKKLLDVLVEVGIIESGYAGASKARGHTAVRLPWVSKKPQPLPPLDLELEPF